jgi:hypothetical protein
MRGLQAEKFKVQFLDAQRATERHGAIVRLSPFEELPNYAPVVRFVFAPVLILSGFWMYAGAFFAIIGVALWLGGCYLSGYGAAILSLVALFIARKTWLVIHARRSKSA